MGGKRKAKVPRIVWLVLPWLVVALGAFGVIAHVGIGNLSDFGWGDIAVLCPLGALETMIAGGGVLTHAIVSLVVFTVVALVAGRAFCGWVCPVPAVSRLRGAFSKGASDGLTEEEKALLKTSCAGGCAERRGAVDSRHFVLGGALLSAAVFGFPVFCLVCPIGLTFATVLLLVRAFGFGDVTLSLLVVPALLIVEVVVFRKWCHHICPMAALMSLLAHANKTFLPRAAETACVENMRGVECGACGRACPEGIDPRHPAEGAAGLNECTRCMKCVEACPTGQSPFARSHRRVAKAKNQAGRNNPMWFELAGPWLCRAIRLSVAYPAR